MEELDAKAKDGDGGKDKHETDEHDNDGLK